MKSPVETSEIHWKKGVQFANQELPHKAISEFSLAIALAPEWILPYFERASEYEILREYENAEADFTKCILLGRERSNELLAESYAGRAYARKQRHNLSGALEDYTTELQLNPMSAMGYLDRSLVNDELGNDELAVADYKKAIELDPSIVTLCKGRPRLWKSGEKAN